MHMFATRLSHLWCVTDFLKNNLIELFPFDCHCRNDKVIDVIS